MSLLLTPFKGDGSIDWNVYEQYVEWQLQWQPAGFFAVCGSSEMKWLTLEERLELARRAVRFAGGRPVVATSNLSPDRGEHSVEIARMIEAGVSGVVLVPQQGLGDDPAALQAYYAELIAASTVPVFLYEWPQVQPYLLDPALYAKLVDEHGLMGLKDTTCTMEGITAKLQAAPDSLVYQANMPYLLESVKAGARGIMAVTTAAGADVAVSFWHSAMAGDWEKAEAYHQQLVTLDAVQRYGYPATAKYLAALRGIPFSTKSRWPIGFPPEAAKAVEVWFAAYQRSGPAM